MSTGVFGEGPGRAVPCQSHRDSPFPQRSARCGPHPRARGSDARGGAGALRWTSRSHGAQPSLNHVNRPASRRMCGSTWCRAWRARRCARCASALRMGRWCRSSGWWERAGCGRRRHRWCCRATTTGGAGRVRDALPATAAPCAVSVHAPVGMVDDAGHGPARARRWRRILEAHPRVPS